ncbi:MAG: cupin domain-containing protein [Acidobacteriaceae bacterium]
MPQPHAPTDQKTAPQPSLHSWNHIAPEQLNPLLTRQFVTGQQAMLARIVLLKGCVVPEHSHPNEQIAFILSGALRFHLPGESHTVHAGEILVIPANVPHSAEALEDTIDFDIFAPPRQDWIDGDDAYLRSPEAHQR